MAAERQNDDSRSVFMSLTRRCIIPSEMMSRVLRAELDAELPGTLNVRDCANTLNEKSAPLRDILRGARDNSRTHRRLVRSTNKFMNLLISLSFPGTRYSRAFALKRGHMRH